MKRIFYLILFALTCAFAPLQAAAQSTGFPSCVPLINGYPGGGPTVVKSDTATHLFWWCQDPKDKLYYLKGFSCLKSACSVDALDTAIRDITRASAKVTTVKALWTKYVNFDCTRAIDAEQSERGALCRERTVVAKHVFPTATFNYPIPDSPKIITSDLNK